MSERLLCPDTTVIIKAIAPDERDVAAVRLIDDALAAKDRIIAPAWMWAEVGSVLRKKVRAKLLRAEQAEQLWLDFERLPIEYLHDGVMQRRAWDLAQTFGFPTLYDAAFLACTELAQADEPAEREYWTADRALLNTLGDRRPAYVRELGA